MNLLLLLVLLCVVAQLKNCPYVPSVLKRNKQNLCWVAVILLVLCIISMNIEGIMVENNNNKKEPQDIPLLCTGIADCNCKSDNECEIDVNNLKKAGLTGDWSFVQDDLDITNHCEPCMEDHNNGFVTRHVCVTGGIENETEIEKEIKQECSNASITYQNTKDTHGNTPSVVKQIDAEDYQPVRDLEHLRDELEKMDPEDLKKEAEQRGVKKDKLEKAEGTEAIINLILAKGGEDAARRRQTQWEDLSLSRQWDALRGPRALYSRAN